MSEKQITVRGRVTDLWADPEGGWSENAASVHEATITVPESMSDAAISRRIKAELGITGMRADDWCQADFGPWRDGTVGAYADVDLS